MHLFSTSLFWPIAISSLSLLVKVSCTNEPLLNEWCSVPEFWMLLKAPYTVLCPATNYIFHHACMAAYVICHVPVCLCSLRAHTCCICLVVLITRAAKIRIPRITKLCMILLNKEPVFLNNTDIFVAGEIFYFTLI